MAKKVNVYGINGEPLRSIKLPDVFDTPYRPDIIKRAVLSSRFARIQPYGVDKMAGKHTTAESRGPGMGISRTPRVKGSQYPAAMRGGLVTMAVGGRKRIPQNQRRFGPKKSTKKNEE